MAEIGKLLVIAGSAKAGTTALAAHVGRHSRVAPGLNKEPRYFTDFMDRDWSGPGGAGFRASMISTWEGYVANYPGLTRDDWAIDASTDYLWCRETPRRLAEFARNADVRAICVVRDPIDRAVSEYNHTLRQKWEPLSFAGSVEAEPHRAQDNWHPLFYHRRRRMISDDLRRFRTHLGPRLLVVGYAEFMEPDRLAARIFRFLDLATLPPAPIERKNESLLPRNRVARGLLRSGIARRVGRAVVPPMLRASTWRLLHRNSRTAKTVRPDEVARYRELIADEIEECRKDPQIPTEAWSTAVATM